MYTVYNVYNNFPISHVAVSIERLHSGQQLVVVSNIDKHLCVVLDALYRNVISFERGEKSIEVLTN